MECLKKYKCFTSLLFFLTAVTCLSSNASAMRLMLYDRLTQQKSPFPNVSLSIRLPDVEVNEIMMDMKEVVVTDTNGEFNLKCKQYLKDGMRPEVQLITEVKSLEIEPNGSVNLENDTIVVYKTSLTKQVQPQQTSYTMAYPVQPINAQMPQQSNGGACVCTWEERPAEVGMPALSSLLCDCFPPKNQSPYNRVYSNPTITPNAGACTLKCCTGILKYEKPNTEGFNAFRNLFLVRNEGYTYEGVQYGC